MITGKPWNIANMFTRVVKCCPRNRRLRGQHFATIKTYFNVSLIVWPEFICFVTCVVYAAENMFFLCIFNQQFVLAATMSAQMVTLQNAT
jgi:hypothetical protein